MENYPQWARFDQITKKTAAQYRREHLGFVFQNFNLLDSFNNQDNIFFAFSLGTYTLVGNAAAFSTFSTAIDYY